MSYGVTFKIKPLPNIRPGKPPADAPDGVPDWVLDFTLSVLIYAVSRDPKVKATSAPV